jgi:ATP adenylyltransferase
VVERLYTPWRLAYVTSQEQPAGCALCRARDGEGGADRLVVTSGALCFVVMNLYPYTGGHVMVTPKRHLGSLGAATRRFVPMSQLRPRCAACIWTRAR